MCRGEGINRRKWAEKRKSRGEITRWVAILTEVISALLSACYPVRGQLVPVRVTGVAQAGAEKLYLEQPCWSLTLSILGVPGSGHCLGQARVPGSCQKHPPLDVREGHRWDCWIFQREWSEAEGSTAERAGRQGREAHRGHGNKTKPSCARRGCPSGSGPGAGAVPAMLRSPLTPCGGSPHLRTGSCRGPTMGMLPPPPNPLQTPPEHRQMSFSGGSEPAVLGAGCGSLSSRSPAAGLNTALPDSQVPCNESDSGISREKPAQIISTDPRYFYSPLLAVITSATFLKSS